MQLISSLLLAIAINSFVVAQAEMGVTGGQNMGVMQGVMTANGESPGMMTSKTKAKATGGSQNTGKATGSPKKSMTATTAGITAAGGEAKAMATGMPSESMGSMGFGGSGSNLGATATVIKSGAVSFGVSLVLGSAVVLFA
ncbi:hypothetical protein BC830DRAFT_1148413 [Chytriomyces sp. MP71]|nr:hypothetical protein BC830DRAFT_1148413 [Chytriomyces sp. MP71]